MEKIRDARRGTMTANLNGGLSKRRQRNSSGSLRDSHEDDGDMLEMGRLRDRAKKDQDRDRSTKNKRRKGDRLNNGTNKDDHDDTSEDSFDDDDDMEEDAGLPPFRLPSPQPAASPVPSSVAPSYHLRCNFPAKGVRAQAVCNVVDKMIGVPVPRKARSAYGKRSQDWVSVGGGVEANHRQSSASPISPSSSSASVKKKIKPISGIQHPRTPKIAKSSSIQEIEIEVAEVLFGMTQQIQPKQGSSQKFDAKDANDLTSDVKSRVSHPLLPTPTTSSSAQPSTIAAAPKRKKPRPVKLEDDSCSVAPPAIPVAQSAFSADPDASVHAEAVENGSIAVKNHSSFGVDAQKVRKPISESEECKDSKGESDLKSEKLDRDEFLVLAKDTSCSPSANTDAPLDKKPDPTPDDPLEKKFCIDLMDPPQGKLSPDRDGFTDTPADHKRVGTEEISLEKFTIPCKMDERKSEGVRENVVEYDLTKQVSKEIVELELESDENQNGDTDGSKHQGHKQQVKAAKADTRQEKPAGNVSMPSPLPLTGWPGSFPSLGYMGQVPPLQSVPQMDGNSAVSKTKQTSSTLSPNLRLKRCATHCSIAKNIFYYQQMAKMNQFWPVAAGALPQIYGTMPYNLNAIPLSESLAIGNSLQEGNSIHGRNLNALQQKAGAASTISGSPALVEAAQSKQFVLQQLPHPGAHGPAVVFSLNQQAAAAAAASGRSSLPKPDGGSGDGSVAANSGMASSVTAGQLTAMNYNYSPQNEAQAQYLAILQNAAFPLSITAPAGGSSAYKAAPVAQAMPYFNGAAFYSSQILPPAQSQVSQQPPSAQQTVRAQTGQQNLSSTSSGSSSSQKHHSQHSKQLVAGGGVAISADSSVHAMGNNSSQALLSFKHRPQLLPHLTRQQEPETAQKNVYGQRFTLPILPQNFALVSSASTVGGGAGSSHVEKLGPTQQQPSVKMESTMPQTFSMSFATLNNAASVGVVGGGAPSGLDFSAMAQNHHTFLQSLPDGSRHVYHQINAPHLKKPQMQSVEDPRSSRDLMCAASASGGGNGGEQERKLMSIGKTGATTGINATTQHQSLNFSRSDSSSQMSSLLAPGTVESPVSRTINLLAPNGNGKSRASNPSSSSAGAGANSPSSMSNSLQQQQAQQQMVNLTKQQQQQMLQIQLASRTKLSSSVSAASAYSERLPAVSTVAKFPPALASFPSHHQGSSASYPQQWNKSPLGAGASMAPLLNEPNSSVKPNNPSQQHSRQQPVTSSPQIPQTQISFSSSNSLKAATGQHHSGGTSIPSLSSAATGTSIVSSSPTSTSKGSTGGSPRASTGTKSGPLPSAAQAAAAKGALSSSSRKSSPMSNHNPSSFLAHPHVSSPVTSSGSSKQHQMQQKQQTVFPQQPQLFFNNAYLQSQAPHLNASAAAAAASSYYQRRQSEQPVSGTTTGILSLSPSSLSLSASPAISDPAKAATASVSAKAVEQKPAAGTRSTLPP